MLIQLHRYNKREAEESHKCHCLLLVLKAFYTQDQDQITSQSLMPCHPHNKFTHLSTFKGRNK